MTPTFLLPNKAEPVLIWIVILPVYRWTAIGWPHKIERQMEQTYDQLDQDEERFRKLQSSDQANFNDRLDTLQVRGHKYIVVENILLLIWQFIFFVFFVL